MKKTILLSSILAVGAAFADATVNSTEVGVMGVAMPTKAALIAVPFLGYDVTDITIADMVNTAELAVGSKLYAPNGSGQYNVWELKSGEGNTKFWDKTSTNVTIDNAGTQETVTPNANSVTTARGEAFWLEPAPETSADETSAEKNCYLLGKPASAAGESALATGVWNLVGNTAGVAKDVPAGAEGEKVCVPNAAGGLDTYTYRAKAKGWAKEGARTADTVTIEPGQGFWYLSKGTTSIAW